jgi:hypothetical protein
MNSDISRCIKSRRMKWNGHIAYLRRREMCAELKSEFLKGRFSLVNLRSFSPLKLCDCLRLKKGAVLAAIVGKDVEESGRGMF